MSVRRAASPFLPLDISTELLRYEDWITVACLLSLSPRECQIVRAMLDDRNEAEIALLLRISRHTVHTYVERLYRKVNVRSRTQLILLVFKAFVRITGRTPQACDTSEHGKTGASPRISSVTSPSDGR